jgi:hypothetical protein
VRFEVFDVGDDDDDDVDVPLGFVTVSRLQRI